MEQTPHKSVMAAPKSGHKRVSAFTLEMRRRLALHLREHVSRLDNETVQLRCRIPDDDAGTMRRDLGHIRSGKPERWVFIGEKRYLQFYEGLGIDPWSVLGGAPPPVLPPRRMH